MDYQVDSVDPTAPVDPADQTTIVNSGDGKDADKPKDGGGTTGDNDATKQLWQRLAQRKSVLTRHINRMACRVADNDVDGITALLEKLRSTLLDIDALFDGLVEADAVTEKMDKWYNELQRYYSEHVSHAREFVVKSQPPSQHVVCTPSHDTNVVPNNTPTCKLDAKADCKDQPSACKPDICTQNANEIHNGSVRDTRNPEPIVDMIHELSLPKIEIEVFSGDPLKYHAFIHDFKTHVDRVTADPNAKIARLIQYTSGIARDAVRSAQVSGGPEGYRRALATLDESFGGRHTITQHAIKSLTNKNQIKSARDMQQFGFDLRTALNTMTDLGTLDEINSQSTIAEVAARLPRAAKDRWERKQLKSIRVNDCYLKFSQLVNFAQEVAREMNDPLYGQCSPSPLDQHKQKHERSRETAHATSEPSTESGDGPNTPKASQPKKRGNSIKHEPCIKCGGDHFITRCSEFKTMKVDERMSFARSKQLCFNCLRSAQHTAKNCPQDGRCLVCSAKHSSFLHTEPHHAQQPAATPSNTAVSNAINANYGNFMPIVPVLINGSVNAHAALDTCSNATFCTQALANTLNVLKEPYNLTVDTLNGNTTEESSLVSMEIASVDGKERMQMSGIRVIKKLPITCGDIKAENFPHLEGLDLSSAINCNEVDLLIGQDFADALIPLACRKGGPGDPFAVQYKFGWTLNGRVAKAADVSHSVLCHFISSNATPTPSTQDTDIHDKLNRLWVIESDGNDHEPGMSVEDGKVIQLWDAECRRDDEHYELPIPWKNPSEPLPNNFMLAKGRLDALIKRLRTSDLFDRYDAEINELLNAGYAEIIPPAELRNENRTLYLPHHNVMNPNKPDKLRVVFDCACPVRGKSLNQRCMQGPDLVNNLLSVLLKFRLGKFAIQADIKAMYNQIRIPKHDRDALRFLWYKDGTLTHMRMRTHLFGGIWCSSASTYALRRTVSDSSDIHPLLARAINECTYVDDCLISVEAEEEVQLILSELPKLLQSGGFLLTKFVVNDPLLLENIPDEHHAKEVHDFGQSSTSRALGVKWRLQDDQFCFDVEGHATDGRLSRRTMLSVTSSLFDPLGLAHPWLLQGKLLFQDGTALKLEWDDQVPEDMACKWHEWLTRLNMLRDVTFARSIFTINPKLHYSEAPTIPLNDSHIELHVFCDASERAYGACIYLRSVNSVGDIACNLIASKGHIAPFQKHTIPRLELQATVAGVKLTSRVRNALNDSLRMVRAYFWTDSMIAIGYIKNDARRFRTFIANRVSTVRALTSPEDWNHVGSSENPADLLTKPYRMNDAQTQLWRHGPDWLNKHHPFWQASPAPEDCVVPDDDPELKREQVSCATTANPDTTHPIDKITHYYSSWTAMTRAVAWLHRFTQHWRNRHKGEPTKQSPLSAEEINKAAEVIAQRTQSRAFASEIDNLSKGKKLPKSSHVRSLRPFLEEGLLRVGGRTGNHPILIPHHDPIATAIARHYHYISHPKTEWTLALTRERYWITKPRRVIKRMIQACVVCKKLFGRPPTQVMADLPPDRLSMSVPPFTYVGLDAFGPYDVAQGRSSVKRYGCIFSCFTSRAIHIELLHSLDTDSFLNAFRRFLARRGNCLKVFSDNGKNFVSGERELREAFLRNTRTTIRSHAATKGIEWHFIPPSAPHMGGVWERMVGVFKRAFKGVLGAQGVRLTDEILSTVFTETEAIVNGRPLTRINDDPSDMTALSPNHLLTLKDDKCVTLDIGCPSDAYRRRWKYVQHLAKGIWQRFIKEYMPLLQARSKWQDVDPDLMEGELVLVVEKGIPRNLWPLGKITEARKGRDNHVRDVKIRTRTGEYRRPISQVIRLELDEQETEQLAAGECHAPNARESVKGPEPFTRLSDLKS